LKRSSKSISCPVATGIRLVTTIISLLLAREAIVVYAHVSSFPQHEQARDWLDGQLNGAAPVGLPWVSLLAFVRLVPRFPYRVRW
jgi:hypothetical protein